MWKSFSVFLIQCTSKIVIILFSPLYGCFQSLTIPKYKKYLIKWSILLIEAVQFFWTVVSTLSYSINVDGDVLSHSLSLTHTHTFSILPSYELQLDVHMRKMSQNRKVWLTKEMLKHKILILCHPFPNQFSCMSFLNKNNAALMKNGLAFWMNVKVLFPSNKIAHALMNFCA